MGRWEDFVSAIWSRILPLIAFIVVIMGFLERVVHPILLKIEMTGVREALTLIIDTIALVLIAITLFAFYQIALTKDIKDLLEERLLFIKSNPSRKEKIETSGAGSLAGMVIGGIIGLAFGAVGVIIGGILGALIGNQAEYESLRAERERKRKEKPRELTVLHRIGEQK